jgi:hypothetical protein
MTQESQKSNIATNQATATTATNGSGGNLCNPNKNLTGETDKTKWLLYLIGEADPLLGFVHAHSEAEALDRVAGFRRKVIAVPAVPYIEVEIMTPERIARRFELFHTIIPAYSEEAHRRTAYFYRREAIQWAKMARQCYSWETAFRQTCRNFAKSYLASYRLAKATAA